MRYQSKLIVLGLFVLCLLAACAVSGCASYRSSTNGRETFGLGLIQIREGRGDTVVGLGSPADAEAERPHVMSSESDGSPAGTSAAMRGMYKQQGVR